MRIIIVLIFCLVSLCLSAQNGNIPYTDISKVEFLDTITQKIAVATVEKKYSLAKNFRSLQLQQLPDDLKKGIPAKKVTKKLVVVFNISNSSDSFHQAAFFPGFFYEKINLYRKQNDSLVPLPDNLPDLADSEGYRVLSLAPHDSATIYAELTWLKTYTNNLRPRLINLQFLPNYVNGLHHAKHNLDQMTYIFSGLLVMMILFSLANYVVGANQEFLYYSFYAAFLGLMLFTKSYYYQQTIAINYFFEAYLDFILQSVGIIFYMLFMQRFLETRKKHPFLHLFYNFGIGLLLVSMIIYTYLHYFSNNYATEYFVENITKTLLLAMIVVFVVYSLRRWDDKLLRFLVWGNIALFVFSLMSQGFILFNWKFSNVPSLMNSSLFYYELGLFLELVFFLMGLSYKNRKQIVEQTRERERLKIENERKEFEKQMAVLTAQQDERNRISADMHDELGSGMTAIRLMSEIAKKKMKDVPPEIERISQSADDVLNKMNAIIWSMNSKNDSLGNLVSYIRAYALEYFEGTPIKCKVNMPEKIMDQEVTGEKRRNLFLCVKETLNNVLKHSKASDLNIDIQLNHQLEIFIQDNGVGIDLQNLRQFGNGLHNIERRMISIGGSFNIENKNGTLTTLQLEL